jgi:hypothetical protein
MASIAQICAIFDRRLGLPFGRCQWHASRLRPIGILPTAQGRPDHATLEHAAILFIAAVVGSRANDGDMLPMEYARLQAGGWGDTLGSRLASYLDGAPGSIELRIDLSAPGATIISAFGHHTVADNFTDETAARPAFERLAIIPASVITEIANDIRTAPEPRAGRPRRKEQFRKC